jgi:hypothetical protein
MPKYKEDLKTIGSLLQKHLYLATIGVQQQPVKVKIDSSSENHELLSDDCAFSCHKISCFSFFHESFSLSP